MNCALQKFGELQPRMTPRMCGGWLAIAPDASPIRIGVTGQTQEETRDAFKRALAQWEANLLKENDFIA